MDNLELENLIKLAPKPYVPDKLPLDSDRFVTADVFRLCSKANKELGQYNGFLSNTPNPFLLLTPITTQEAVLSSKLEGTHATIEDVLNHEAGNQINIQADEIKEIQNYRTALFYALDNISVYDDLDHVDSKSPLTVKIIKEMHKILLDNVRGASKHPGNFKVSQNYIGGNGHISFTPLPFLLTDEYMSNLERYIHYDEVDYLIQAAVLHAQFEMIHPFEDGNGRIGRLLIPLFLYYRGVIPIPVFYMSSYFNNDKDTYIEKLANISQKGSWDEWIRYFLNGVINQAHINTEKARAILNLYNELKDNYNSIKSYHYIEVLDFIFAHPIFNVSQMQKELSANKQTFYNIIGKMVELNILSVTPNQRNRTYIFTKLLDIVNF